MEAEEWQLFRFRVLPLFHFHAMQPKEQIEAG